MCRKLQWVVGPALLLSFSLSPVGLADTLLVTTVDDSGLGSLREAMLTANTHVGTDTIAFAISGTGSHTIRPLTVLPSADDTLVIDGYTQPGSLARTQAHPAFIAIELDGSLCSNATSGIIVLSPGCTVRGLAINRFAFSGIALSSHGGTTIVGNHIGTDVSGILPLPNGSHGIRIWQSEGNMIGGTNLADRNVISGNNVTGVFIQGEDSRDNIVMGNYIGVDAGGGLPLGNYDGGIHIIGAPQNTIGGTMSGAGNTISWNGLYGVLIKNPGASMNRVEGNLIGTDATGTLDLGNRGRGVLIRDAPGNTIGGLSQGAGNVISGNQASGISIRDLGALNNVVQGNLIGTDVTGARDLGNSGDGVFVWYSSGNTIGGTVPAARNVISGNEGDGVLIRVPSTGNMVQGNYIGTDATGTADLGNSGSGVGVSGHWNIVGGEAPGAGNLISGNIVAGVSLVGSNNVVCGNLIGVDVTGTSALCNEDCGLYVSGPNNTIGGLTGGAANTISGNVGCGIYMRYATGARVLGNLIGVSSGGSSLGNSEEGIQLKGASQNWIGGHEAGAGNTIAFNGSYGVKIREFGDPAVSNSILGNSIHSNQDLGINLHSSGDDGITPNDLGDTDTGPNELLNFPELTTPEVNDTCIVIAGTLNTHPLFTLRVEFFASSAADPSGFGEGQTFLGYLTVVTDSSGNAAFSHTVPLIIAPGSWITATASDSLGNTSEFSLALQWNPLIVDHAGNVENPMLRVEVYPNPPSDYVSIKVSVPAAVDATAGIYDPAGRLVRVVQSGYLRPESHVFRWNLLDDTGRRVSAGVYACVVQLGKERRSMVFVLTH